MPEPGKLLSHRHVIIILILLAAMLAGCGGAAAPTGRAGGEEAAPAPEEEVEEPVEEQPQVIYGDDDRQEAYVHSDATLREMAGSVALLVAADRVRSSGNQVILEGQILSERLRSVYNAPLCSDELYGSQLSPGYCTGFLIDSDLLVTAGHCLKNGPTCASTRIVFGFQVEPGGNLADLTSSDVYRCQEVISAPQEAGALDYAIIRLDRPAGRPPFERTSGGLLSSGTALAAIGYPSSLPLKIVSGASITDPGTSGDYFTTNLDTFGGSSGSPVIDLATYQVAGMLVSGEQDYAIAPDGTCVELNRCPESGGECSGEVVLKASAIEIATAPVEQNPRTEEGQPKTAAPPLCGGAIIIVLLFVSSGVTIHRHISEQD